MWDFRFGQVALMAAAGGGVERSKGVPFTLGDIFPSLRGLRSGRQAEASTEAVRQGIQNWVAMCWTKATGGRTR